MKNLCISDIKKKKEGRTRELLLSNLQTHTHLHCFVNEFIFSRKNKNLKVFLFETTIAHLILLWRGNTNTQQEYFLIENIQNK